MSASDGEGGTVMRSYTQQDLVGADGHGRLVGHREGALECVQAVVRAFTVECAAQTADEVLRLQLGRLRESLANLEIGLTALT